MEQKRDSDNAKMLELQESKQNSDQPVKPAVYRRKRRVHAVSCQKVAAVETVEEQEKELEESEDEMVNKRMTMHEVKVQQMDNQTRILELRSQIKLSSFQKKIQSKGKREVIKARLVDRLKEIVKKKNQSMVAEKLSRRQARPKSEITSQ